MWIRGFLLRCSKVAVLAKWMIYANCQKSIYKIALTQDEKNQWEALQARVQRLGGGEEDFYGFSDISRL